MSAPGPPPAPPRPVTLVLNTPVTTRAASLTVTGMEVGSYTFSLVVRDDIGLESVPATLQVVVRVNQ